MTIKRTLFRIVVRILERITLISSPSKVYNLRMEAAKDSTDMVTVAFNNVMLIELQHRLLKKFIKSPFTHIVVDNSNNKIKKNEIFNFCKKEGIAYVGMPKNWLQLIGGSYAHAMSVNYVWHRYIKHRSPCFIGTIDHDCFPIVPIDINERMAGYVAYGKVSQPDTISWFLHPSISIFRFESIKKEGIDYMPAKPHDKYLDCGGSMWYKLYRSLDIKQVYCVNQDLELLRSGGTWHGDTLQYLDEYRWLHTLCGSCWIIEGDQKYKEEYIKEKLERLLEL